MTPPPPRVFSLPRGEPVLAFGPADGPQMVVLQPLFEEMNRCRALVVAVCRGLAARGVGCWLPDLPGTGESSRALEDVVWSDWTTAITDAAALVERETGSAPAGIAIRGGALLDGGLAHRWRLSPVSGASLLTDLRRSGLTGEAFAGYALAPDLAEAVREAVPGGDARTVRLMSDERACDLRVEGPQLWRRSEPVDDAALAAKLIEDVCYSSPLRRQGPLSQPSNQAQRQGDGPLPAQGRRVVMTGAIAATLDGPADATHGWVLVTGGTQTRVGPHRLYERLAAHLAAAGHAVIRFDRPGTGDSPGLDPGYDDGTAIVAATAALRAACPTLTHISGFGLCDGATGLALHGRAAGIDDLVLANPWVVEPRDDLPPAAAIRGHYRDRLRDPRAWLSLLRGGVDLRKLARGLARSTAASDATLATRIAAGLTPDTRIILADGDGTARAYEAAWRALPAAPAIETIRIPTASHSFASKEAFAALAAALTRPR